jgi:two-component system, OmpR family, sensor histidine kinase CpxA
VRIFLRLLLAFWAAMQVLTTMVVFISPLSSSPQDERSQTLPLQSLEKCAANAAKLYASGGAWALRTQDTVCEHGLLIASGTIPETDLGGRTLSREERMVAHRAQSGSNAVVMLHPKATVLAFRSDPNSAASDIFLVTVPGPPHNFTMWHTMMFVRLTLTSGLFALLVTAYFARPIARLNRAAEQFGAGDLKARADPSLAKRKDEVGDLGRTFNLMAERIESLILRYKSFLAHASHELGSPLTRLNLALALARRKGGQQLEPELDRIAQEANRLNILVQELLLLARLESGNELSRNPVSFDVGALVEDACGDANFEAAQLQKTVAIVKQDTFPVCGHPDLLRRAVDNLLRNALRFARKDGRVEVSYFRNNGSSTGVIVVQDDGQGVPAGQEESIFEPFVTLPGKQDEAAAGSGLGLAIARTAVSANGGTIYAQSASGTGLAVTIEIPTESLRS